MPSQSTASRIECPKYEALRNSKRCANFVDGGACALPEELMCIEWLRANGHPVPSPTPAPAPKLFQLTPPKATAASSLRPAVAAPPRYLHTESADRRPVEPLPADQLQAFKGLGVEVQLDVSGAHVHLVPRYTGQDRIELSVEHAATLRLLLDSFPGARVVGFGRSNPLPQTGERS
jgi:hypothetical protein